MVDRPRVFEQEEVKAALRQQGVPEASISPTISFMRLVIPIVIRKAGVSGVMEAFVDASKEWGEKDLPGWANSMAPFIVQWASNSIEAYKTELAHRAAPDQRRRPSLE